MVAFNLENVKNLSIKSEFEFILKLVRLVKELSWNYYEVLSQASHC